MVRWRHGPAPWWPTVYAEQQYIFPDAPSCHDPALEHFAVGVAGTLLRTLPARYAGSFPVRPVEIGNGIAAHELQYEWPQVFQHVLVVTPQSQLKPVGLQYFRYHPDVFDDRAGWAGREEVIDAVSSVVASLRYKTGGLPGRPIDEYAQKLDLHREWHPSSYRLAWATTLITNELIHIECDALRIPEENRPYVLQKGLQITARPEGMSVEHGAARL